MKTRTDHVRLPPTIQLFQQPEPEQVLTIHKGGEHGDENTGIIRRWRTEADVRRCQLCRRPCTAKVGRDGQVICYVEVKGHVEPDEARLLAV